jgi:hypothetical protein
MKKTPPENLRRLIISSPYSSAGPFFRAYCAAAAILISYLGNEWFDRHVMPTSKAPNYLYTGPADAAEESKHMSRLIELAELLYNLDDVPGFIPFLIELQKRSDIQAKMAELSVAKLLKINNTEFHFVSPTGKKSADYDIELRIAEDLWAPCETKCKLEGTSFSISTIINSYADLLKRKQLPKDRPGIVFMSIPQQWILGVEQWAYASEIGDDNAIVSIKNIVDINNTSAELFNRTSRVLSVIFFSDVVLGLQTNWLRSIHMIGECINEKSPFISSYKGGLLKDENFIHQDFKTGPNWQSLYELVSPELMTQTYNRMKIDYPNMDLPAFPLTQ